MLNCHEASQLASNQLDERLPVSKRISLALHFMLCRHCRRFARQIERLRRIAATAKIDTDAQLSGEARERLRNTMHQQGRTSSD